MVPPVVKYKKLRNSIMPETVLISSDFESRKELIVLPNTQWYWTRDPTHWRLSTAFNSVLIFHLGTLAFGSSVIAVVGNTKSLIKHLTLLTFVQVKILRFALEILEKRLGRGSNRCSR